MRTAPRRTPRRGPDSVLRPRWLWVALAAPAAMGLVVLFVVPLYTMAAVAGGRTNLLFQTVVPVWNPLQWSTGNLRSVWHDIAGTGAFLGPAFLRTIIYTTSASILALVISYPVAYFVARRAGRRRGLFLFFLVAPFWVSYMMRMLAWIDLLQTGGLVNHVLLWLHVIGRPVDWLGGRSSTVILGLVYGYVPYLTLVLFAGLDRIDSRLLEAARDLGLTTGRTFWRVTIPLSRPTILAGMLVTALPMVGDYFTNQLLSSTPSTTMIGNQIEALLSTPGEVGQGAVLALGLLAVLLAPIVYYVASTSRSSAHVA